MTKIFEFLKKYKSILISVITTIFIISILYSIMLFNLNSSFQDKLDIAYMEGQNSIIVSEIEKIKTEQDNISKKINMNLSALIKLNEDVIFYITELKKEINHLDLNISLLENKNNEIKNTINDIYHRINDQSNVFNELYDIFTGNRN